MNNNPWLALSTYQESDEYRFFGREEDTAKLFNLLQQNECVVIYAASGDGKSSVINAGLSPLMRRNGYFPIKITFSSDELRGRNLPIKPGCEDIDFNALVWNKIASAIEDYRNRLISENVIDSDFEIKYTKVEIGDFPESDLWYKLRTHIIQDSLGIMDYIPVIIFDQFEEILRCSWKSHFFAWLERLMKDYPPHSKDGINHNLNQGLQGLRKLFKLIFSMRYEYVGELDYWCSQKYFIPQMMQNRYFLKPISESQAIEIIKSSEKIDETTKRMSESAEIIIDSISSNSMTDSESSENISAIVLSLTCFVIYEEWNLDSKFSIDKANLGNIIYDYYRSAITGLGIEDSTRRVIERILISSNGSRLRIPLSDERLQCIEMTKIISATDSLSTRHIIKEEKNNGVEYIELIHDKLAEAIFAKRDFEKEIIAKEKKQKKIKCIIIWFSILSLIALMGWFSYYSLTYSLDNNVDIAYVRVNNEIQPKTIQIDSISELNDDFHDATNLTFSRKLKSQYKDIYCDYNVGYIPHHGHNYAGNAKEVVFPFNTDYKYPLSFGNNTRKIVLLYPHDINYITAKNPLAEVYVPYNIYEDLLLNPVFENVHLVKMGVLQTFYYKISYEFQRIRVKIRFLDYCIPAVVWYGLVALLTLFSIYIIGRKQENRNLKPNIKTLRNLIIFTLTYLLGFIIYIYTTIWLDWENIEILVTVIFTLCGLTFSIAVIFLEFREIWNFKKAKIRYTIVYCDSVTKEVAIKLRRVLISTGIEMVNINMRIYKNNVFDLNQFKQSIKNSKRIMAIFSQNQIENQSDVFKSIWEYLTTSSKPLRSFQPIIYGEQSLSSTSKTFLKKRGTHDYFPPVFINDIDSTDYLPPILKDLKSQYTPKFEIFKRYYLCIAMAVIILIALL